MCDITVWPKAHSTGALDGRNFHGASSVILNEADIISFLSVLLSWLIWKRHAGSGQWCPLPPSLCLEAFIEWVHRSICLGFENYSWLQNSSVPEECAALSRKALLVEEGVTLPMELCYCRSLWGRGEVTFLHVGHLEKQVEKLQPHMIHYHNAMCRASLSLSPPALRQALLKPIHRYSIISRCHRTRGSATWER